MKSIIRDEASYVVRIDALDEAFPNEEEEPEPVRAERGKVLSDYITGEVEFERVEFGRQYF